MGIKHPPTCFPILATHQGNRLPTPIQWGVGTSSVQWTCILHLAHEKVSPEMGAIAQSHTPESVFLEELIFLNLGTKAGYTDHSWRVTCRFGAPQVSGSGEEAESPAPGLFSRTPHFPSPLPVQLPTFQHQG